jgi:hypothetical protein
VAEFQRELERLGICRLGPDFYLSTAKRFLFALQRSVQRHETAFGVIETDVRVSIR